MSDTDSKVLWVDDDASGSLEPLARRLRRAGISLDIATTFDAAERRLQQTSYSAVLIDIILPYSLGRGSLEVDLGIKLARRIRQGDYYSSLNGTRRDIQLVFLTVVQEEEVADGISGLGAEYFDKIGLLEPGTIEKLIHALRKS